jgi:hypothetical protein
MKKIGLLLTLFCLLGLTSFAQVSPPVIFDSIEKETQWKRINESLSYDAKALPNFRPRDARIFTEYGFKRLDRQDFQHQGNSIDVEIYQMEDATAAYGIFTFFRNSASRPLEGIGSLGEEQDSKISFVQNSYYIKLTSASRSSLIQAAILKMGQIISRALPKSFMLPPLVSRLPRENLVKGSVVYFLGFQALNQKHPFGSRDIFGLVNGAEAVLADYQFPEDSAKLLLIYYPTQQLAKKYLELGYQACMAQNPNQSIFFKRDGPQVGLILGSKSAELATALLEKLSYVSTVSWDPKAQPVSVARMMLNIFIYTGVMLALALGAGVAFGLVRILAKRLFPDRIFDRPKSREIIRLNLPRPEK